MTYGDVLPARKRTNFQTAEVNHTVDHLMLTIADHPDGGSADLRNGELLEFSDGFLVGGVHPPSVLLWPTERPLGEARTQIQGILQAGRGEGMSQVFVGWWRDHDVLFVEVAQYIAREGMAKSIAQARHELAYYDVRAGKDVRL